MMHSGVLYTSKRRRGLQTSRSHGENFPPFPPLDEFDPAHPGQVAPDDSPIYLQPWSKRRLGQIITTSEMSFKQPVGYENIVQLEATCK